MAVAQDNRRHVEAYLAHLANERRLSPHTLSNYRRELAVLLDWADERSLALLQPHDLRAHVRVAHAAGLGGRSLSRRLSVWRVFYQWMLAHQWAPLNPCAALRAPKSPKSLPKTLSVDEASVLLDAPLGNEADWREQRDLAMFELLYSSGLRLAELTQINLADAKQALIEGEIVVIGKRNKARVVPLGLMALAALGSWIALRGALAPEELACFVSQRGRRITGRAVELRLAERAQRLGMNKHVHPHMLRHSCASHVLQSSGDLRAVQEMLGHASIASTQVYTHLDFQHLAAVYDQAHPRSKRKTRL